MSLAEDSPVHSSSSGDFAAILDAELDSISSEEGLPEDNFGNNDDHDDGDGDGDNNDNDGDDDDDDDDDIDDGLLNDQRRKRLKAEKLKDEVEPQGPELFGAKGEEESETSGAAISFQTCYPHPGFIKDMCIRCGKRKDDSTGVAFGYIHKDLELGVEEVARLRGADLKQLLRFKKLYLVLDLDHTLLNSTRIVDISPQEEYLNNVTDLGDDLKVSLFRLEHMHMMTKLRPFVRTFLKEASKMFEMYIYAMAERSYALEMANILDPEKVYFSPKVISQADCTQRYQKGLDVVLGSENAVIILDDTEMGLGLDVAQRDVR